MATGAHLGDESAIGRGADADLAHGAGSTRLAPFGTAASGRSGAWLAHLTGGQGVAGSNPVAPTSWNRWPFRLRPGRFLHCCSHIAATFAAASSGMATSSSVQ